MRLSLFLSTSSWWQEDREAAHSHSEIYHPVVERDAMGSGMDLFLTKPVPFKSISQIIHDYTAIRLPLSQGGKRLESLDENT